MFGCLALIIHSPNHAQISQGVSNVFPLYFSPYFHCISTALSHVSSSSPIRAHLSFVFWQRHALDSFSTLAFSCYFVRSCTTSLVLLQPHPVQPPQCYRKLMYYCGEELFVLGTHVVVLPVTIVAKIKKWIFHISRRLFTLTVLDYRAHREIDYGLWVVQHLFYSSENISIQNTTTKNLY